MHCLDLLFKVLGKRLPYKNTQIIFPKNVDNQLPEEILQHTIFSKATSMGGCLGENIAVIRPVRGHFNHITPKFNKGLVGGVNNV